jgi:hypothetical protein
MDEETAKKFIQIAFDFYPEISEFADAMAEPFNEFIKKFLPPHLYGEINKFIHHCCCGIEDDIAEKCIEKGILYAPDPNHCSEGTYMEVTK